MTAASKMIMPDFCGRRIPFHYITAVNLLMKIGIDPHRVEIMAMGEYKNYRGEVREQEPAPGTPLTGAVKITLKVGYPSAVDKLPYQYFYGLAGITERSSAWDRQARELMAPFDASMVRYDSIAHYQTLKYTFGTADKEQIARFLDLFRFTPPPGDKWGFDDMITWVALLPGFHFWAGNPRYVEKLLEFLMGYECTIVENVRSVHEIPDDLKYHLGNETGRLGHETIMGDRFAEYDSCYEVRLKNVDPEHLRDFFPDGRLRKKMEWILKVCMPNSLLYRIIIKAKPIRAVLASEEKGAYLGYSMRI